MADRRKVIMSEIQRHYPPASLAAKQTAVILASERVRNGQTLVYAAPYLRKWALVEEVNRLARRGEVFIIRGNPVWSHERGQWEVLVRKLKDPAPRWHRPAKVAGGLLASVGALIGAGWWLLSTLTAPAAVALLAVVLVLFVAWVAPAYLGRGGRGSVEVNVNVKVKH